MINMFLSNNPSSGGYKFVEFALFELGKTSQNLSSAAVVIGALRVNQFLASSWWLQVTHHASCLHWVLDSYRFAQSIKLP